MSNNDMLVQILKIVNDLKDDVKDSKREIQKSREIEEAHWQENLRRWEQNEKRWEENDRRWEENEKRWEKYEENRKSDRKFLLDTLLEYDISISTQLGDPNVQKMQKIV